MEAKPPVTYLREDVRWETIRFPGGTIRIPIPIKVPYQGPARAANSYVAEVTAFAFDKAKLVALPEISLYTHKQLLNCADTNVSSTVSLALTGAKGWSFKDGWCIDHRLRVSERLGRSSRGRLDPPSLVNKKDQTHFTFPNIDLAEGDSVDFVSTNKCPPVPDQQQKIERGTLKYRFSGVVPGGANQMKYFFVGDLSK